MEYGTVPITSLKGIGDVRSKAFAQLGIYTTEDLLRFLPREFHDFTKETPIAELKHGQMAAVRVRILSDAKFTRFHGITMISVEASDGISKIRLKWYNQPFRHSQLHAGETKVCCGRVDRSRGVSMINPQLFDSLPGLLPIYPLCKGLTQRFIRDAVKQALQMYENCILDSLPDEMLCRYQLCSLKEALFSVHFPSSTEQMKRGHHRLAFENLLMYLIAVEMERQTRKRSIGIKFDVSGVREKLTEKLPFPLTQAQQRVLDELDRDFCDTVPMNRLVQGDVGSGKTVIALYALCVAAANGYQGVMLAPTEILAKQHYETLKPILGDTVCLLTSGMKKSNRDQVLERLRSGTAFVAVGTHALLQDDVRFEKLGMVITDEQHRFGVSQRAELERKGIHPDVLVMSATPIPRTLAMLLYGDLDVSVLDELPPGRKPIKTSYIPSSRRKDMYDYVAREAHAGHQTYVVCPYIESTEGMEGPSTAEVYADLRKQYPDIQFGLLHGRMPQQKKDTVIEQFRSGKIQVLISTTVVEVGVHVENASIMIIEGAEHFGLAQLHQLRGRVGRGSEQAYCFLLSDHQGEATLQRLSTMVESSDGFYIAEQDLLQRGPGEFLGTRQHGTADANVFDAAGNMMLLQQAKAAAAEIMDLPNVQYNALIEEAMHRYHFQTDKITMN